MVLVGVGSVSSPCTGASRTAWPTELQANQLSLLPDAFSKKDARADQATRFFQKLQMPQVAMWSGKECSLMCTSRPGKLKHVT